MTFLQQATNFFSNIVSSIASFVGSMLNRVNTDAIGNAFTSVKQTGTDATASLFQTAASYIPSNGPDLPSADMDSEDDSPVVQRRSTRSTRYQGSFKY